MVTRIRLYLLRIELVNLNRSINNVFSMINNGNNVVAVFKTPCIHVPGRNPMVKVGIMKLNLKA